MSVIFLYGIMHIRFTFNDLVLIYIYASNENHVSNKAQWCVFTKKSKKMY